LRKLTSKDLRKVKEGTSSRSSNVLLRKYKTTSYFSIVIFRYYYNMHCALLWSLLFVYSYCVKFCKASSAIYIFNSLIQNNIKNI
uniref:Uncharacterized protein n=1 Tax=Ciona savignyi TaxID=51511 RepID=H2Z597_CIOSA